MAAMMAYTNKQTAGNKQASSWGSNMDMSSMPEWSKPYMAQNIMYTRTVLAANPEVMKSDGSIDLSQDGTPLMIPQDISVLAASGSTSSSSGAAAAPAGSSAAPAASGSSTASPNAVGAAANGAGSIASPTVLVGLMSIVVALLAL